MRYSLCLISALTIAILCAVTSLPSLGTAIPKFLPPKAIDLGAQLPNQLLVIRETLRNKYQTPLGFTRLRTSCGCLSGAVSPLRLRPGRGGKLVLRLLTHGASGKAGVSALLSGRAGRHIVYQRYVIQYHVRQMVNTFGPGRTQSTPGYVDIGSVPLAKLAAPVSLRVMRGGFRARWDTLECFSNNHDIAVKVHPVNGRQWRVSLRFLAVNTIGPQSADLRLAFLHNGKPLRYQLNEIVSLNVVGPIKLSPQELLLGVIRRGQSIEQRLSLWPDKPGTTPRLLGAEVGDPRHFRIRVAKGGTVAFAIFTPGKLHGRVHGSAQLLVDYNGTKYHVCLGYLGYVVQPKPGT